MTTRREQVIVEAVDDYSGKLARMAGATELFRRELDRSNSSLTPLRSNLRGMDADSRRASTSIDQFSGRVSLAIRAIAGFGPAAVPITTALVPALAGVTTQLGFLALAGGAALLAFNGVGDALGALEDARLDPTIANLTKAQQAMSELPTETRRFVTELDALRPTLGQINDAAAAGLMPGLTRSLDDLEALVPRLSDIMRTVGDASGDLVADGAEALAGPEWEQFFSYLQAEAGPAVETLGQTIGNLTRGVAELWMAMDPLSDDFTAGFLDASENFAQWADGLSATDGYREFVDYVRTTGPQVLDAVGSLGDAILQIGEAAAPLGGPVLQIIEGFADALATIADSPLGTPLLGLAAIGSQVSLMSKAVGGVQKMLAKPLPGGATMGGLLVGGGGAAASRAPGAGVFSKTSAGIRGLTADVRSMSTEYGKAGRAQSVLTSAMSNTTGAAQRTRQSLASVGRGAAVLTGVSVAASGAADGMGLTNTASLALMGTLAGPWGAAVGGAVGYALDFAKANDDAAESIANSKAILESGVSSFTDYGAQLQNIAATSRQALEDQVPTSFGDQMLKSLTPGGFKNNLDVLFGGVDSSQLGKYADDANNAALSMGDMELAGNLLAKSMGIVDSSVSNTAISTEQQNAALAAAAPAMSELGYSLDDLVRGAQDGSILPMVRQIEAFQSRADSAQGRTDAFASSVADLAKEGLSTAQSANAMGAALESLLAPALNAEAATDQWRASLQALRTELQANAGFAGNSQGAMENRAMTRDYATASIERLKTLAAVSTTTERDMARAVAATRSEFIKSGQAAGFSRKEIAARAKEMGLTPKLVKTVFDAAGITKTQLQARELRTTFNGLPKRVQTELRANGIPKTAADVDKLVRKYQLTEKERRALVSLRDQATPAMEKVLQKLGLIDRTNPNPKVTVNTGAAIGALAGVSDRLRDVGNQRPSPSITVNAGGALTTIGAVAGALAGLQSKTITVTTRHVTTGRKNADGGLYDGPVQTFANGGFGSGGRYYHRVPQIVRGGANIMWGEQETGWEAYISGKPSMRGRNVAILDEAARRFGLSLTRKFADGGTTGGLSRPVRSVVAGGVGSQQVTVTPAPLSDRDVARIAAAVESGAAAGAYAGTEGVPAGMRYELAARDRFDEVMSDRG